MCFLIYSPGELSWDTDLDPAGVSFYHKHILFTLPFNRTLPFKPFYAEFVTIV